MTLPETDDVTVVSRRPLVALLEWAAYQPCGVEEKAVQCRLRDELAAPEPPVDEWTAELNEGPQRCPKPGCALLLGALSSALVFGAVFAGWVVMGR